MPDPAAVDLAAHPRLYFAPSSPVAADDAGAADDAVGADDPITRRLAAVVAADAADYVDHPDYQDLPATHNAHLIRARIMQHRVLTLIAHWRRTGDRRCRDSALAHVETMGRWEYWSWITWRQGDARPEAIFDLSYGENSATIGLAYDLLHADLEPAERRRVVEIARRRSLVPFLDVVRRGDTTWFRRPDSNWNTVCAGGAGMLALAMHEELPEARAVLALVEESVVPFMRSLEATDGGWPEGIGYWGYGMSYAFRYLLSHERATGTPHPLLEAESTRQTVDFPFDFCPHGQPCSFGDSNHWSPSPIHYRTARRLGRETVVGALRSAIADGMFAGGESRAHATEALLLGLGADVSSAAAPADAPVADSDPVRLYRGLGWARLADRWPDPRLYLAIRGGVTGVPHGHRDLLSFHAVVGAEHLIENLTPHEYLDTTFGPRRDELFEMGPQSKNAPLVNGVGVTDDARADPTLVDVSGCPGIVLDASDAIGVARNDERLADYCGRLFVLFGDRAALVLDRIDLAHEGRVETRLHTRAEVLVDGRLAHLVGREERMTIAYAALAELSAGADAAAGSGFGLVAAPTTPTTPGDEATMLRWHGPAALGQHFVMAALLAPGDLQADVQLDALADGQTRVRMRAGDWAQTITVGPRLQPSS